MSCLTTGRDMPAKVVPVNIGNARLYGMEEELGLSGNQFQIAVSILFVTYCVSTPFPSAHRQTGSDKNHRRSSR